MVKKQYEDLEILLLNIISDCEKCLDDVNANSFDTAAGTNVSATGSDHQTGNYLSNRLASEYSTPPSSDKSSFHSPLNVHHGGKYKWAIIQHKTFIDNCCHNNSSKLATTNALVYFAHV